MLGVMAKKRPIKKPVVWTPEKIKALRERLGLNQSEAAEKVGVSQSAWSSWERGKTVPDRQSSRLLDQLNG